MRRVLIGVVAFLLLGAIVNVAVAWGLTWCATDGFLKSHVERYLRVSGGPQSHISKGIGWITIYREGPGVWTNFGLRNVQLVDEESFAALVPISSAFGSGEPGEPRIETETGWIDFDFTETSAGWPIYALRGTRTARMSADAAETLDVNYATIVRASWRAHLPYQPTWPGFAINTVFYAVVLWGGWLLFAAPFALRRRRRIKRGLCPKCAYPVGDSPVCTECGAAVSRDGSDNGRAQ